MEWGESTPKVQISESPRKKTSKRIFSEKATKYDEIFQLIWRLLSKIQIKWKILSNFWGLLKIYEWTLCPRIKSVCKNNLKINLFILCTAKVFSSNHHSHTYAVPRLSSRWVATDIVPKNKYVLIKLFLEY